MQPIGELTILPSFSAWVAHDGKVTIGRKFLHGMEANLKRWGGPITVLLPSGPQTFGLDEVEVDPSALGFRLLVDGNVPNQINRSAVVLAAACREQAYVAHLCAESGVPCAYVTEYTLTTRLQIVFANTKNPILRARRALWEWRTERIMRRALRKSAGAQCNGTPTYKEYCAMTKGAMLFFDTRSSAASMATDQQLAIRNAAMLAGLPLRLIFSGRLVAMKGADHLVDVARSLTALGFSYTLTIAGDGDLTETIRSRTGEMPIELVGVLDFETELQPLLASSCDLFVCCHRQGDPSCTYLETMSAGVPIVSYDNEAFVGINNASGNAGWGVPMNRPDLMANRIASLPREEIAAASRRALAFARHHSMESVFDQRVNHLKGLAGLAITQVQPPKATGVTHDHSS